MKWLFKTKKRGVIVIFIILVLGYFIFSGKDDVLEGIEIGKISKEIVEDVVSETGFVQASREVTMAFERSGKVETVFVEVGDVVKEGQILAQLDTSERQTELNTAYARLQAEQARLNELVSGADGRSLDVAKSSVSSAQTALDNAESNLAKIKSQHNILVENARKTLLKTGLQAFLTSDERENSSYSYVPPTVSGTYEGDEEVTYIVELYNSKSPSGSSFRVSGPESGTGDVSASNPTAVGTRGLFIQFPSNFARNTKWEIPIPNTRSSSYLTNLNAYKSALEARDLAIENAENAVKTAKANLEQNNQQFTQTASSARDEKVEAQKALVSQMQSAVEASRIAVEKMALKTPFAGVVTNLLVEEGEILSATAPALSLISDTNLELVVNISESDIQQINVGDTATVIFDAYDDDIFEAKVTQIAPTAVLLDGVRALEITLQFLNRDEKIRVGLSADVDILAERREAVLAVPTRSIVELENGKFVRAWIGEELITIPVKTGLRGSNGLTEIISGLDEGQEIITFARDEDIERLKTY